MKSSTRNWCDSCISDSSLTFCDASRVKYYNSPLRLVPRRRFNYILTFSRTRLSFPFLWLLCKKKSIGLSSVRVLRDFCHYIFSRLSYRRSKLGHSSKPHPTYDSYSGEAPDQQDQFEQYADATSQVSLLLHSRLPVLLILI